MSPVWSRDPSIFPHKFLNTKFSSQNVDCVVNTGSADAGTLLCRNGYRHRKPGKTVYMNNAQNNLNSRNESTCELKVPRPKGSYRHHCSRTSYKNTLSTKIKNELNKLKAKCNKFWQIYTSDKSLKNRQFNKMFIFCWQTVPWQDHSLCKKECTTRKIFKKSAFEFLATMS